MKKKKLEKPEILEFLKTTRTLIRQLKQFEALKMLPADTELIEKGLLKLRDKIDKYLEKGKRS